MRLNLTKRFARLTMAMITMCAGAAYAQTGVIQSTLLPANPTSADTIKLIVTDAGCQRPKKLNGYGIKMEANVINIDLPNWVTFPGPPCDPSLREEFDIGRLPAGSYSIDLYPFDSENVKRGERYATIPFVVTDARATKQAPWPTMDYTGMWWAPTDPGHGLFIWQDARAPTDPVLAAWYTYGADGKPAWYTFQPKWATSLSTAEADLIKSERRPGTATPPPNPTSNQAVGKAKLEFASNSESTVISLKLTITFTGSEPRTWIVRRFSP